MKGSDTMETLTISLSSELKEEIEESLQQLHVDLDDFVKNALQSYLREKNLAAGFAELEEMERTGDYGKGYTDVDLMMKELLA